MIKNMRAGLVGLVLAPSNKDVSREQEMAIETTLCSVNGWKGQHVRENAFGRRTSQVDPSRWAMIVPSALWVTIGR